MAQQSAQVLDLHQIAIRDARPTPSNAPPPPAPRRTPSPACCTPRAPQPTSRRGPATTRRPTATPWARAPASPAAGRTRSGAHAPPPRAGTPPDPSRRPPVRRTVRRAPAALPAPGGPRHPPSPPHSPSAGPARSPPQAPKRTTAPAPSAGRCTPSLEFRAAAGCRRAHSRRARDGPKAAHRPLQAHPSRPHPLPSPASHLPPTPSLPPSHNSTKCPCASFFTGRSSLNSNRLEPRRRVVQPHHRLIEYAELDPHAPVDGDRKHRQAVVVDVLPDQVDPPGRPRQG